MLAVSDDGSCEYDAGAFILLWVWNQHNKGVVARNEENINAMRGINQINGSLEEAKETLGRTSGTRAGNLPSNNRLLNFKYVKIIPINSQKDNGYQIVDSWPKS